MFENGIIIGLVPDFCRLYHSYWTLVKIKQSKQKHFLLVTLDNL